MMIWDVLDVAGAVAGLAVLAVMALVPLLLALPLPSTLPRRAASAPRVWIPAQRAASPTPHMHHTAA